MAKKRFSLTIGLILLFLLAACQQEPDGIESTNTDVATLPYPVGDDVVVSESPPNHPFTSTVWLWESFQDPAGINDIAIADPDLYRLVLNADGSYNFRADCNVGGGAYVLDGNTIRFGPGAATLAACPPGSQADHFVSLLGQVAGYVLHDGKMILNLMVDGGNMTFGDGGPAGDDSLDVDFPEPPSATLDPENILFDASGLPNEVVVRVVEATPYDNSQLTIPTGLPEHVQINFLEEGQTEAQPDDPVLYIIPAEAYRQLWEQAGDTGVSGTLAGISSLVGEQPLPFPNGGIPVLPIEQVGAAFNDFAVMGRYLDSDLLQGMRFVGRFVEAANPVTNTGLTYIFQGFTADGQHFISFHYPVTSPALPDDIAGLAAEDLESFETDVMAYLDQEIAALSALSDADWIPNLSLLDGLITSLTTGESDVESVRPESVSELAGSSWQWLSYMDAAVGEVVIENPEQYTITFNADGSAVIQADCNTVVAAYNAESGAVTMTPGASTLAACPAGSQDQYFLDSLGLAAIYFFDGGDLYMDLPMDGGTLHFGLMDATESLVPESAESGLLDTVWVWPAQSGTSNPGSVDDPARYTIQFNEDGSAAIQADCNTVGATYATGPDNSIAIVAGPSTLAACPPDSRGEEFVAGLTDTRYFLINDGILSLEIGEDGTMFSLYPPGTVPESAVPESGGELVGPLWQWAALIQGESRTEIAEPSRYTILFNADGTAAIHADCNQVGAGYVAGPDGSIDITPGPTTTAYCGEGSFDQIFLGGLSVAESYTLEDGLLRLVLQNQNGILEMTIIE